MTEARDTLQRFSAPAMLVAISALGCGTTDAAVYDRPFSGAGGQGGGTTSSAGAGGEGGAGGDPECSGRCVPIGPLDWFGPGLLWIGHNESEAPECPPSSPVASEFVFNDLNAPNVCGACKCDAPSGSCALPTTMTAASAPCDGGAPGVAHTPFNAPEAWDGSCTTESAIPANQKCNGVNCVQSLTIAPLTLTEAPCGVSVEPVAAKMPHLWGAVARTCHGSTLGACTSPAEGCSPPASPGFEQCLTHDGDRECPAIYPIKHLFYYGLEDTRDCTPCACGAPVGSTCTAQLSVYKDSACSVSGSMVGISSTSSTCFDVVPSGQALGSKLATAPIYAPGSCQASGGEPIGKGAPAGPTTFCCLAAEKQ